MGDHIDGRDIAREQQQPLLTLPERLDNFLYTTLELTSFGGLLDSLVQLLGEFLACKRGSYGGNGIGRDSKFSLLQKSQRSL